MSHAANNDKQPDGASPALCSGGLVLHLPLTHHWYDETERGAKCVEYRVMIPRWEKQIWQKRDCITHVRFSRGYTARTLTRPVEHIDIGPCPIPGWAGDYYRIHFLQNSGGETRRPRPSNTYDFNENK